MGLLDSTARPKNGLLPPQTRVSATDDFAGMPHQRHTVGAAGEAALCSLLKRAVMEAEPGHKSRASHLHRAAPAVVGFGIIF